MRARPSHGCAVHHFQHMSFWKLCWRVPGFVGPTRYSTLPPHSNNDYFKYNPAQTRWRTPGLCALYFCSLKICHFGTLPADTLEDARFVDSQFVKGPPHVRFYSGAPLVSDRRLFCCCWFFVVVRVEATNRLAVCVAAASSVCDATGQLAGSSRGWCGNLLLGP